MASIRWLAPETWVEEHDPWRLWLVLQRRGAARPLMETARWMMLKNTMGHVQSAIETTKVPTTKSERARSQMRVDLVAAWLNGDRTIVHRMQAEAVEASMPGHAGLAAMMLIDAALAEPFSEVVRICMNVNASAAHAPVEHHVAASAFGYQERRDALDRELSLSLKRGIPYPHADHFGLVAAHGDGWVLYHHFRPIDDARRKGQWSAQVLPQLMPAEQHGYTRTHDVREAIDFLGHRSPEAMRDAIKQLRESPQLGHVLRS